jgi:predicted short-subunit dehydrogenase-like oxidoreductase (DUF2520 family)
MAAKHPARLRIGLIGSGRVGVPLAVAFGNAGHQIIAVSGISQASTSRIAALLPNVPVKEPHAVCDGADLVILAVPDDSLADLIAGLVATGAITAGQMVLHTSGIYGVGVLDPVLSAHALPLAIHPVMTFTGTGTDVQRMAGASFAVTAPDVLLPIAQALVMDLGGEPFVIAEEDRIAYHAALAWSSNFLATLINQGAEILHGIGVANPERVLAPLLGASLDNSLRYSDASLTGPIARGDVVSVEKHRHFFSDCSPGVKQAYLAMARLTAERAIAAGLLSIEAAGSLLNVLSGDQ